jgi:signal transduction histidine kinase
MDKPLRSDDDRWVTPLAQSLDQVREARIAFSWRGFVAERRFVVLPIAALVMILTFFDPAPWRGPLMLIAFSGFAAITLHDARRRKYRDLRLDVPILMQILAIEATGGLDSPLLGLTATLACLVGGQARHTGLMVLQIGLIWTAAILQALGWPPSLVPAAFGGTAHGHTPALVLTTAFGQTVASMLAYWIGRKLREGYDHSLAETVRARDEILALSAAHARELQAVSGEISHELKNPLATVRGLVELMAMGSPTPHDAERLAVLQREVVRIQSSVEELLNLARPLSPLALAPVDLAPLCEEVCALHEGLAGAVGVVLRLEPRPVAVRADYRKLKQILINLVQNAIEASPAGGPVTVSSRDDGDRAAIVVTDGGHGVDGALAPRIFEPGVTSKGQGAGLGLTIARSLARQHGGDVTLKARAPHGCEAVVFIPKAAA